MKSNLQNRRELSIFSEPIEFDPNIFMGGQKNQSCLLAKLVLVFAMGFISQAYAQTYPEIEPNNSCQNAQDLSSAVVPTSRVVGYKAVGDVDFFKFSATPGSQLRVTMSRYSPTYSPLVGFFTSSCAGFPERNTVDAESTHLDFTVPSDGVFIIGASACCDLGFSGSGTLEGGYGLSVGIPTPPTVVTGLVVDADTGTGLPGDQPPFASVTLEQCFDGGYCYSLVST